MKPEIREDEWYLNSYKDYINNDAAFAVICENPVLWFRLVFGRDAALACMFLHDFLEEYNIEYKKVARSKGKESQT